MSTDPESGNIILVQGRKATDEEIGKNARSLIKLAETNGWQTLTGYSRFRVPADYYKGTDQVGELKTPEHDVDQVWIQGIHQERRKKFVVTYHGDAFANAFWGLMLAGATDIKALIKGDLDEALSKQEREARLQAKREARKAKKEAEA